MAELHRSRLEVAGVNGRLAELSLHLKEEKSQWSKERAGLLQSVEVEGWGHLASSQPLPPPPWGQSPSKDRGMRIFKNSGMGRGSKGGTVSSLSRDDLSLSRVPPSLVEPSLVTILIQKHLLPQELGPISNARS